MKKKKTNENGTPFNYTRRFVHCFLCVIIVHCVTSCHPHSFIHIFFSSYYSNLCFNQRYFFFCRWLWMSSFSFLLFLFLAGILCNRRWTSNFNNVSHFFLFFLNNDFMFIAYNYDLWLIMLRIYFIIFFFRIFWVCRFVSHAKSIKWILISLAFMSMTYTIQAIADCFADSLWSDCGSLLFFHLNCNFDFVLSNFCSAPIAYHTTQLNGILYHFCGCIGYITLCKTIHRFPFNQAILIYAIAIFSFFGKFFCTKHPCL